MKTCLIVDDSRVIRKVERGILAELNFEVSEAEDGSFALAACRSSMPDVILLDWNMPNMNGIEFLCALRQEPGGDVPLVIFCTTESDMSFIETAMAAGANEYIMKPFDHEIMRLKLSQVGLV
jgi:two-component system chemotaxis response regulator CheY